MKAAFLLFFCLVLFASCKKPDALQPQYRQSVSDSLIYWPGYIDPIGQWSQDPQDNGKSKGLKINSHIDSSKVFRDSIQLWVSGKTDTLLFSCSYTYYLKYKTCNIQATLNGVKHYGYIDPNNNHSTSYFSVAYTKYDNQFYFEGGGIFSVWKDNLSHDLLDIAQNFRWD